ncbi:DUF3581 family protein [Endozoicomonas sp. G2_1]|uniref:DUF3581 family protein n=1 Tax=Endozoicomonas sp. G2_1 TaxID=2821091 RepID=UPI001ADD5BC4|nr:DUF3581 family protein [Endozoicomonas sp. G2_1]MBO9491117.1 DUF3581 family protein [Endozoicomonas sp. G2_1]
MFIEQYYHTKQDQIFFSRQQASDFAKNIADDFNPLHDIDAKKFCVPGDLLFAVMLAKLGLYENMHFNFLGMVSNDINLNFPSVIEDTATVTDDNGKEFLSVSAHGTHSKDDKLIDSLTKAYVEFSGHTFPHILVKLMAENGVMINPTRPMIMYESMSITLSSFPQAEVELALADTSLTIEGKRATACLQFDLIANQQVIGHGKKHMLLSGLRPYCADTMDKVVADYIEKKANYTA